MNKKVITNRNNISIPLAVWLALDEYDYDGRENVISATTLLKPIRQIVLGRRYRDSIKEVEVSDMVSARMGVALHDSVEKAWSKKDKVIDTLINMGIKDTEDIYDKLILEKRSEKEIDGFIISGQFDIAFGGTVCDIKSTSVWSYIFGSKDEEYKLQMSIYKWLNQDIITDDYGYIEMIFTDWSQQKALQDKQYPQSRIVSKKIKLYSINEIEKYIKNKIALIKHNETLKDEDILECSDEDLWTEQDKWKVYMPNKTNGKINQSRATKVFDTEDEAHKFAGVKGLVVEFKGGVKRCKYCSYTNLCNQYIKLQMQGRIK